MDGEHGGTKWGKENRGRVRRRARKGQHEAGNSEESGGVGGVGKVRKTAWKRFLRGSDGLVDAGEGDRKFNSIHF